MGVIVREDEVFGAKLSGLTYTSPVLIGVTISSNVEASDRLGTQPSVARESLLRDFFSTVEEEHALLLHDADRIISSLTVLNKLRNSSIRIAAIGRLPPEILASVFTIAADTSRNDDSARPSLGNKKLDFANVISSVCTYWREIAIDTPALWGYIDLTRRGGIDHALLWLQRARSYPLYARVMSVEPSITEQYHNSLLEPHISQLQTLVLDTNTPLAQHTLLQAYTQSKQKPLILESLALKGENYQKSIFPPDTLQPSKAEMDDFLRPISELYLKNAPFHDWTSAAFHGLQSLGLVAVPDSALPSCTQILDMLHASPGLQFLELSSLFIRNVPKSDPTPVTLSCLETLWIHSLPESFEDWLFKAIIPGKDGLTLGLSEYTDLEDSIGMGLSLAAPERIETLYFCWNRHRMYGLNIQGLLEKFPNLKTIALKNLNFSIDNSGSSNDQAEYGHLEVLDLVSCRLRDPEGFEDIALQHSIEYLRMYKCAWVPTGLKLFPKFPDYVVDDEPGDFMEYASPFD